MKSRTLTALDIGTSSIKGICARKDFKSGDFEVLAYAQGPCFGVRNGEVVKPEQVSKTLLQFKEELNKKSGLKIKDVLVNIGGNHLYSIASQGLISVSRADQKISREDIQRVIRAAQAINLPSNKEVLDIFPKEFIIDGEAGIKDPLGLQGIRLEAKVLLICVFSPILENLEKAVEGAGLQILEVVPSFLASSWAVLNLEQKELGVALVEIGAGTTSLAVFEKGELLGFSVFPIGSANITNDIAIGLRTDIQTAEKIKINFATLEPEIRKSKKEKIEISDKSLVVPKKMLKSIVESRVSEMFFEIQKTLKKITNGSPLPSGIVFTGGGANLPGLVDLAKQKFKLPCQLGSLKALPGIEDIQFSTCAGLLLKGFNAEDEEKEAFDEGLKEKIKKIFKTFLP